MIDLDGRNLWGRADLPLAGFAVKNSASRGRIFSEVSDPDRLPFQRDRDRIIHTASFRRLGGKMQVVSPRLGDHFRNRLTHTLEVAQLARDLARNLRLNEDLAEAIALAHDLGHPPFGHSGEVALDAKMRARGGRFDHNLQSARVVEFFERRYADFPGLNLTREVLEGLRKHETFFDRGEGKSVRTPHLESQVVDLADEISYLSADLEDGLRGGFFSISDLKKCEIPAAVLAESPNLERSAIVRRIMNLLFRQIVADSKANLRKFRIDSLEDAQNCPARIVAFSPEFFAKFRQFKKFCCENFYFAPDVQAVNRRGQEIISTLFDFFVENPREIPRDFLPEVEGVERVCDYIAGMTDGFAEKLWEKISNHKI